MSDRKPSAEPSESAPSGSQRGIITILLGIAVVIALSYAPLLGAGFASDDHALVLGRSLELSEIPGFFAGDLWQGTPNATGYYRPLMMTSLAVDHLLWGDWAGGYHLHSIAWHIGCVVLLYLLIARVAGGAAGLLAAAFFGLHPLQSEAVAFISARNDPMATALLLAAILLAAPKRPGTPRLALAGLAALAACLTKENAILGLLLLPMMDWIRWRRPRHAPRYLALGAGLGLWAIMRWTLGPDRLPSTEGGALLLQKAPDAAALYLRKLLVPWPLSDSHTLVYLDLPTMQVAGLLLLAAITAGLLIWRGGRPAVVGLAFAALTFAPALAGIMALYQLAERYTYMPMIGLALALAACTPPLSRRWLLALPVLALWTVCLSHRLPEWASSLTLAHSAVEDAPSPYSHGWLGDELANLQRHDEALPWFQRALDAEPPYCPVATKAVNSAIEAGDPATGLELGRIAYTHGCAGLSGFREAWALAHLLAGDSAGADRILTPRPPCDASTAVVITGLALQSGQQEAAQACAEQAGTSLPRCSARLVELQRRATER